MYKNPKNLAINLRWYSYIENVQASRHPNQIVSGEKYEWLPTYKLSIDFMIIQFQTFNKYL